MIGYRYSPFSKPLAEFPPEELNLLRDVTEGWFVDYKLAALSPKVFGKHLSAFANQFGGWLFVGIAEAKDTLKAGAFTGIPTADVWAVLVQIREGVSAHVSPLFYFDHRVIDGPVDAIGLEAGKSIIVVGVPEGPNPPFVHSSGKIYRRIADSSEPKAETDRAVLDAMWRKSEDLRSRLRDFILQPTENPQAENTCCYVYLMEDLTFSLPEYRLDLQGFREAMQIEGPEGPSMILDNLYATQDGFIARHVHDNDPLLELAGLRWWRNGNARFTIPLNFVPPPSENAPIDDPLLKTFIDSMGDNRRRYHRILNLDQWSFALFALTMRYLNLRDKLGAKGRLYGKIVFSNARKATPFLGMPSYVRTLGQYGLPVVQDTVTMFPVGLDPNAFITLADEEGKTGFVRRVALIWPLALSGLKALGITFDIQNTDDFGQEFTTTLYRGAGQQEGSRIEL
jgi:hypothetical protein